MKNKAVVGFASVGIAVVLAAAVLAFAVPEDHEVSRSAVYPRSPDQVFDVVTTYADLAGWRSDVESVRMLASDRFIELRDAGEVEFHVTETKRPIEVVAETNGPGDRGGSWSFQISVDGTGSRLTITERGTCHDFLDRVKTHYTGGHAPPLDRYLVDLGHHFGEDVELR